ncbi:Hint domain-containing protein [Parasaccharibacter apium]|uniref:Hint domain-containing protein n=1 Tax=Parasaccharibacter apium TaxID=1510841 RepID=UPI0009D91C3C|nr:Hint domain-containing protein [Parasaccharibacter apium]
MPGNPQPVVALGTYRVNIASLSVDANGNGYITSQLFGVDATFTTHTPTQTSDQKVQDFVIKDPNTGSVITSGGYDFSWGNKAVNGFIIGNGSGGYYVITSDVPGSSSSSIDGRSLIDPTQAQYSYSFNFRLPWSIGNNFTLWLNGVPYTFKQDDNGTATDGSLGQKFTFDTCFLSGTMIETLSGAKKVENLTRNDVVITYNPETGRNEPLPQHVVFCQQSRVRIDSSLPLDMAGYPVRIKKNALADNVPSEDLLVTAEHCLLLEKHFIPVRIMVNGRSIYYDTSMHDTSKKSGQFFYYDIFHIETSTHSIISANNVLTESYLNTGNRFQFQRDNGDTNVIEYDFTSKNLSWEKDAAAPLCTAEDFVAPIHQKLLERAKQLLFPVQHAYKTETVSHNPALQLLTEQGHVLQEKRSSNNYKVFHIPAGVKRVTILSKTGRPYDVHGPVVDDRRELGVLVGEILYFHGIDCINIDRHLTHEDMEGWFDLENSKMRWTKRAATLDLPHTSQHSVTETGLLAIEIISAGPYPADAEHPLTTYQNELKYKPVKKAG